MAGADTFATNSITRVKGEIEGNFIGLLDGFAKMKW